MVKQCYSFFAKLRPVPEHILQSGNQTFLFNYLAKHGKQVSELDLSDFSTFNNQDLKTIIEHCPNLQKLTIQSKHTTDLRFQHLQALKGFEIFKFKLVQSDYRRWASAFARFESFAQKLCH